ncbi:MAG TPA: twin-arginine translocase subunit TatC, partial [Rhodothermales bacterium]|nr:twin-arginine translocase subunit TatC [Rhodothermales bacterium]
LVFAQWVMDVLLLGPTRLDFISYRILGITPVEVALQNRLITGQFFAYWGTVLATGILLGMPFIVWQFWRFIEPGLYRHERASLRFAAFYATFFFLLGVAFGYFTLTPIALQFFAQFTVSDQISNEFDITKYFEMVLTWSFGTGLLFELPVVVFVLARLGVVTKAMLKKGRKFALIIILIVAAVLTPPDPLSQIILAVPMLGLYELSILQAGFVERGRKKAEAKAAAEAAAREAPAAPTADD